MADVFLMPSSMPQPGVFKQFVSGREDTGQLPAFFNSTLTNAGVDAGTNATLTIYLRLYLVKRNPSDGIQLTGDDGKPVQLRPWDDLKGEFTTFRNGVKKQADAFWDQTKFCLVPPADYRGLDFPQTNPRFRPNIDCRFEIIWASGPGDAHATIDCFCPVARGVFRSNAAGSFDGNGRGQWTCYDLAPSSGVIIEDTCMRDAGDPLVPEKMTRIAVRCRREVSHEAVCHEVGHLLGQSHVGMFVKAPACMEAMKQDPAAGRNDHACYIGRNDTDAQNIMGGGMALATWNVMPWATRITSHTGVSLKGWNVSMKPVPPRAVTP